MPYEAKGLNHELISGKQDLPGNSNSNSQKSLYTGIRTNSEQADVLVPICHHTLLTLKQKINVKMNTHIHGKVKENCNYIY